MEEEKHPFFERDNKLSTRCKILIAVAILVPSLLMLTTLGSTIGLATKLLLSKPCTSASDNVTSTTCMTSSCVQLAGTVLSNMDASVDPCEDFYNYSCGGWVAKNTVPSGFGSYGVFQQLSTQNTVYITKLITGTVSSDIKAINLTRTLYKSCADLDGLDKLGAAPLIKLISRTGGWELVGVTNNSAPKWTLGDANYLASVMYGNTAFFQFGISVNDKNSSQYIASLQQSGLTLPSKESYTDSTQIDTTIPALRKFITSTLALIGGNTAEIAQAANQIIQVETELSKIFVSNVALRDIDASYNLYMLSSNLSDGSLWKQFNWTNFIESAFNSANVNIDDDLPVIVRTPSYFANLTDVYSKFNNTVLENYFKWQLVQSYVPYLGNDFLNVYYAYTNVVLGSGKIDRYLTCVSILETLVPFSISRLYTDNVLPAGTRGNVSVIVNSIKAAFKARIEKNNWLDDETKKRSKWKVGNITAMIAYPDGIYNDTVLNEETQIIDDANGQLFDTAMLYVAKVYVSNLQQFGKKVDKTKWEIAPTAVNAYYEPLYNGFVFLEGILNAPFFDAAWPNYFKYGGFGVVAGHELTHGFDDQGQRYNQDGVLTPWWTKKSVEEFNKRKVCFIDQYSKYSMFGFNVNGNLTLGENIADNGGLKTSYEAFTTKTKGTKQQRLPGLEHLSPDQLFFVSFAQLWCSMFTPEYIKSNLLTNPHSPGPFRVVGSVSNSVEFATAFKCSPNSKMNPKDKCELW